MDGMLSFGAGGRRKLKLIMEWGMVRESRFRFQVISFASGQVELLE